MIYQKHLLKGFPKFTGTHFYQSVFLIEITESLFIGPTAFLISTSKQMVMLNSDRIKKKGQPDYPILFSYICFLDSIVSKVVSRKDIHQPKHSKFTRKRENSA